MKIDEIKTFNVENLATAKVIVEKNNADAETRIAANEYASIVSDIQVCDREIAKYTKFKAELDEKAKLFSKGKARAVA